jgi:tRNA (mo5U34)-methyltransferase
MDERTREAAERIRWFHSIDLGDGYVTRGHDDTAARSGVLGLPADLTGKTVLDVGAWDGFFSFEAERRGAERVVAADSFAWNGENWSTKDGFLLAREALGSRVEDVDVDVLDLDPQQLGTFDVVLFLGVMYHMRHPLLALEKVASVTGGMLVLETAVDCTWTRRPMAAFYPQHGLAADPTNWWGPNPEAVVGMLSAAGFSRVEVVSPDGTLYRAARSLRRTVPHLRAIATRTPRPPTHPAQGRAVFHAYR